MALYDPWDTGYTDYVTKMMRKKALQSSQQKKSMGWNQEFRSFGTAPTVDTNVVPEEKSNTGIIAIGIVAALILFGPTVLKMFSKKG